MSVCWQIMIQILRYAYLPTVVAWLKRLLTLSIRQVAPVCLAECNTDMFITP